jgi:c-di-GMP-binding flagellar brake protein YcgR
MDQMRVQEELLRGKILNIGMGTRLQVQLGGMEEQFKSNLIGMEPDWYLIIQLPMMTGILNKLHEGNRVTVRYLYSGHIYGFSSSVIHFSTRPTPHLFLNYPKTVEVIELRKSKRVDCHFPGKAIIQEYEYPGAIVDISSGGCKFSFDASGEAIIPRIEVGEAIKLIFQLPGSPQQQAANGNVRSITRDQTKVVLGIEFDVLDKETAKNIEALIESFLINDEYRLS